MSEPAVADPVDLEVQEAVALCGGDPMKELRFTPTANAFLAARVDELTAQVSAGFGQLFSQLRSLCHALLALRRW